MKYFHAFTVITFFILIIVALFNYNCNNDKQNDKLELRYYMWGTPTVANLHRELLNQFEKENPGVSVRLEASNWGAYWDKLQIQLASGAAPDVYWMSSAYFYNFVDAGVFRNLAPYIKRDSVKLENYFQEGYPVKSQDEIYGLWKDMTAVVLFYNKNMFDEQGLAYPDESWDWNDFLVTAKKLTIDVNGDNIIDQWGTAAFMPYIEEYIGPMVFSNGGLVLNESKTKCLLDQPAAIEAIQFMVDLLRKHKVCVLPSQTGSVGGDPFMTGQVAMIQNISALIPEYSKVKNFHWSIAPIPKSPQTNKRITTSGCLVHVINSETKHPEMAWKLVKFLSEEKAQTVMAESKLFVPSLKKVAQEVFTAPPPDNMIEVLKAADYAHDLQPTANWLEWNNAVQRALEPAFLGNKSVSECCQAAVKAVDRIINE